MNLESRSSYGTGVNRFNINNYFAGGVETPLRGYKLSGYGREKGIEALHHFTQVKCVSIRL
jgi:aldehyde dehydrogenase (NAD+)